MNFAFYLSEKDIKLTWRIINLGLKKKGIPAIIIEIDSEIFNMTYEGDKSILYYKNVLEKEKSSLNFFGSQQDFKQKIT